MKLTKTLRNQKKGGGTNKKTEVCQNEPKRRDSVIDQNKKEQDTLFSK